MTADNDDKKGDGRGDFFAVEGAAWAKVCQRGSMNEAVAYLALARGSHFGTRKTSWSVEAIETRTNISRIRAKMALQSLVASGLVRQLRAGTKPQYYLPTAYEIGNPDKPVVELSAKEDVILFLVEAAGGSTVIPPTGTDKNGWPKGALLGIADGLVRKGKLYRPPHARHDYAIPPVKKEEPPKPEWTWLPNSIVDGIDGVAPPIEQIRQTQEVAALRLFVDLYFAQSLAFNGGVHWRQVRVEYSKELVGQSGIYDVWGFGPSVRRMWTKTPFIAAHMTGVDEVPEGSDYPRDTGVPVFWNALANLERLGLVQIVPHIIDADTDEGEVVHPYGIGIGEPEEQRIGRAAHYAGHALLNEEKSNAVADRGLVLAPLHRHRAKSEMVGLVRTTHRARTTATSGWLSNTGQWSEWADSYEEIKAKASASEGLARSKGRKGGVQGK
ncbi:hypothetical protein [Methylobacterium sp. Leaf85]|uniref:hypothetical protein n=1 Tax=Methylobacterium sp. Leaf85 TaxID=1736241 RepID=UPI0006F38E17|nr:hypothetical protein [Methylobacterium sp. Leaf85]KQO49958.1 hypothetical protein ASF08_22745 [Methylobacterium sp. Leaf85]